MNNHVFGAYLVVKIQSKNRNDLGKYECVPTSWVTVRDNYDNTVVFGYPLEDRIHTRFRVIEYQPLDKKWPTVYGEVVFDTDSQEDAFQFIETKTEHESIIHDQSKDTNKQDDKEVKLTPSSIKTIQPIDQTKKKFGLPCKRKLSDRETIPQNKNNGAALKKRLELEILEAQELIRTYGSDFDDEEAVISSTPKSSHNLKNPDVIQIFPNETDIDLEETYVNKNNAQETIQRPRRKSTRLTKKYSVSYVKFLDGDLDRSVKKLDSTKLLPYDTDNAIEETHVNKKHAQKMTLKLRRKSTRSTKNNSKSYVELSDEDFDRCVNKLEDTQILSNGTHNALEETNVNKKYAQNITQRTRRKSTRPIKYHSELYVGFSDEDFDRSVNKPYDTQILPNETDTALEETHVNKKHAQKMTLKPRRKSTRPTKYHSESYVEFSDEDFDRSVNKPYDTQILPNETDTALEETHVTKKHTQKMTLKPRRKSTRSTKNNSKSYVELSDEDFDRCVNKLEDTQILPNGTDNALEETNVNKKDAQNITQRTRRKSTRPTKYSELYVELTDEDFDRLVNKPYDTQILANETDTALEETRVNKKGAQKITQRTRRKSTRPTKKHSESYVEFSDENFDRPVNKPDDTQILPNETGTALDETHVNKKGAQKITQRTIRKSTRPTKNHSESYVEFSDEDFDRPVSKPDGTEILPNDTDTALEETHVNKKGTPKITQRTRRKSTRPTKKPSESYVEISDKDFDKPVNKPDGTQILPNETDTALEETHVNKKGAPKITQRTRRKSTRLTKKHSESYVEFSDEDFDRPVNKPDDTQILPNETDTALEEKHIIKKNAQKITKRPRRKSTHQTKYYSESYVKIPDEDFDRSVNKPYDTQIIRKETDNTLKETHINQNNAQKIMQRPRRKSTRQTKNLSESYVEFSDADFDRSDDSDYVPEIALPELPRPLGQSVPATDQDINKSLLNDQVYSECYNFYFEFNESYQKIISILDNAENYLQNCISRHKNNVAAKDKQPSPSPVYQQPYAISPNMFSHPQPLLQERSSITEEDTRWTIRYPEPGPGIIELMPNTGVYVSEKGLKKCKSRYTGTTNFTRGLLEEVFTDEALRNCSFTGITRKKISSKPSLDPKARKTFVDYVLEYSLNKGWEKADPKVILNCIKNKLLWFSRNG